MTPDQRARVEGLIDKSLRFAGWTAYPADAYALRALLAEADRLAAILERCERHNVGGHSMIDGAYTREQLQGMNAERRAILALAQPSPQKNGKQ